jgi:hypothetical protein
MLIFLAFNFRFINSSPSKSYFDQMTQLSLVLINLGASEVVMELTTVQATQA